MSGLVKAYTAPVKTKRHPVMRGVKSNCRRWGSKVAALKPIKLSDVAVARASKRVLLSMRKVSKLPESCLAMSPVVKCVSLDSNEETIKTRNNRVTVECQ